jgi:hypothetical protein
MKKFLSIICITLLFTGVLIFNNNQRAFAGGPAPVLSQFSIIGYSDDQIMEQYGRANLIYRDKSDASTYPVIGSTAYIVTKQIGYGTRPVYYVDGNYRDRGNNTVSLLPLYYSGNNVAYGFIEMDEVDGLTPGTHTIKAICSTENPTSTGQYPMISDTITLTVNAK